MNKKIIAFAILGALMLTGVAQAQTADLPDPGTLPNSPFYFVKSFFEGAGTFFTFGNSAKAERYLALAEKRLTEAEALATQGDERAQAAVARYEKQYAQAKERAERADDLDLEAQINDATTRHLSVLDRVLERVPEQAKESVRAAKERSVTGQLESLRKIAERDPETAVDIFARAAEGRLNAANARAGRSETEEAGDVEKALEEFERYSQFGQEISTLAEGLQTGETTVEELVQRATSQHLQVLEDVRQKLPPQAQEQFQRALESAKEVQQLRPAIPAPQQRPTPGAQPTPAPRPTPAPVRGNDTEETESGRAPQGVPEPEQGENDAEEENGAGGAPQGMPAPFAPGRP